MNFSELADEQYKVICDIADEQFQEEWEYTLTIEEYYIDYFRSRHSTFYTKSEIENIRENCKRILAETEFLEHLQGA